LGNTAHGGLEQKKWNMGKKSRFWHRGGKNPDFCTGVPKCPPSSTLFNGIAPNPLGQYNDMKTILDLVDYGVNANAKVYFSFFFPSLH